MLGDSMGCPVKDEGNRFPYHLWKLGFLKKKKKEIMKMLIENPLASVVNMKAMHYQKTHT